MVNIRNVVIVISFLVVFVFMSAIGILVLDGMITAVESSSVYSSDMAQPIKYLRASYSWWDYTTLLMMTVFIIGIAVTSFKLRTRPIGYIVAFISVPFLGFISYFFNYVFIEMMSNDKLATVQIYFPMSMIICTNLHWVALTMFIVGSIMLFSRDREEGGEILS